MNEKFSGTETKYPPLNILLVEDNEADLKIALRAFQNARFPNKVFSVIDGQECLDYLHRVGGYADINKFPAVDLILLDISMPRVDGFGVLSAVKTDPSLKTIPIVILSASKNEDDVRRSYEMGANSFIQKPMDYDEFVMTVDGLMRYWEVLNRLPGRKS